MNQLKNIIVLTAIILPLELFAYGWIKKADFGGVARHRTTMLTIGNKIFTGLGHYNGAGVNVLFNDWWEYDPATNAWTQKADYLGGICYHATGFTIDQYGYVGTGRISPSGSILVKDFFRFDAATNTWLQLSDFPGVGIRGGVGFSVNGYGYIGTGETSTGYTNTFYRYTPSTDSWIQIASLPTGGRISAVAFTIDGYSYVGTGYDSSVGWSTADLYRYNPALNGWSQMASVGGGVNPTPIPRMEASGFALDGKGYILTGDNISSGDNYNDMYEYDPVSNSWDSIPRFPGTSRRYLSSTAVGSVAYCGLGTNGTNFKDFWQFDRTLGLIQEKLEGMEITAYPNPSIDYVNFQIDELASVNADHLSIIAYDNFGKEIDRTTLNKGSASFQTKSWMNGIYFYSLVYNGQVLKTGKLFVTK